MTNYDRQINYLRTKGFIREDYYTLRRKTELGEYVVQTYFMKCNFIPKNNCVLGEVTLRELYLYIATINDDLDHLKLNGCI